MKFDVLTLFPEMFVPVQNSIIGRATKSKILEINLVNMRDFSEDKHNRNHHDLFSRKYAF